MEMAGKPRAVGWVGGLSWTAVLVGCIASNDPPPAQPSAAGSIARNVVLFIGDGMGVSTVTAARIFDGQSLGMTGEEHELIFETFPHVALVKTYNTNQQVPDSAGTATAMMTGRKTRAGVINIGPEARRRDCQESLDQPLIPIGVIAKERGKWVGIVTTTRLTHATPASVFAHTPERDWESDRYLPESDWALGCRDIAHQLAHFDVAGGLDVALGGGRAEFFGGELDGNRRVGQDNLIQQWRDANTGRTFVSTRDELAQLQPGQQVLGVFSRSHLTYVAERVPDTTEPTLAEMTTAAIDLLEEGEDGYFLMVEGGRIDHGHHDGKPGYALLETQAFARAIEAALERVDLKETLVLVTADHSHVFTISGYPVRGNRFSVWWSRTTCPVSRHPRQPWMQVARRTPPWATRMAPAPWPDRRGRFPKWATQPSTSPSSRSCIRGSTDQWTTARPTAARTWRFTVSAWAPTGSPASLSKMLSLTS